MPIPTHVTSHVPGPTTRRSRCSRGLVHGLLAALVVIAACEDPVPPLPPTGPASITLTPTAVELTATGETARITAEVKDEDGQTLPDYPVDWVTSDTLVATVSKTGLVRAESSGTARITASAGSVSAMATVTVIIDMDREALVALYQATSGQGWRNKELWLSDDPLGNWYGVETNADGQVVALNLRENGLSGTLPPEIGDLAELDILVLNLNRSLSGTLPPELGKLSKLRELKVSVCSLSGPIPPELGNLTELRLLWLDANSFSGSIPPELGNLSKLEGILLEGNQLTGPIPPELGKLSNLDYLQLHLNSLTGSIPSELGNLSKLQYLILYNNELSGSIPPELGGLTSVVDFRLDGNRLSGPLPPELGKLVNVKQFMVIANELTGPIPPEFGNLASVERLYLWSNELSGSIPPELGNLLNLEHLVLAFNQLSGPIPPELGDLPRLLSIKVHANNLTGEIPGALGKAPLLRALNFASNDFSGSLPPGLFDSPHLAALWLRANRVSGPVPPEIGNMASLSLLDLRENIEMAGPLPLTMTALDSVRLLFAIDTGLCAPTDPDFQAWLEGVVSRSVATCGDGEPPMAYLTQAEQHLDYPVPLVANQPAPLRVFVTAWKESNGTIPEVHTVTITGKQN